MTSLLQCRWCERRRSSWGWSRGTRKRLPHISSSHLTRAIKELLLIYKEASSSPPSLLLPFFFSVNFAADICSPVHSSICQHTAGVAYVSVDGKKIPVKTDKQNFPRGFTPSAGSARSLVWTKTITVRLFSFLPHWFSLPLSLRAGEGDTERTVWMDVCEDARMREDMRLSCLDIPSLPRSAAVYPDNTYLLIKERFSDIGQPCNDLHALIHRRWDPDLGRNQERRVEKSYTKQNFPCMLLFHLFDVSLLCFEVSLTISWRHVKPVNWWKLIRYLTGTLPYGG